MDRMLILLILFALIGSIVKMTGSIFYGSKALYVDALTCLANFVALTATIYYFHLSKIPADEDHHYGHYRLGFGGTLASLLSYSFVAGLAVSTVLLETKPYSVGILAPLFAGIGFSFYLGAIIVSRRISRHFIPYAVFTVSELIESFIVIITSLAGALYTYLIDYSGAVILVTYLFYELYKVTKDLIIEISDIAPPKSFVEEVKSFIEENDVKVLNIKIRLLYDKFYHGDIVIGLDHSLSLEEAHKIVERIRQQLLNKYSVDTTITPVPLKGPETKNTKKL